MDIIFVVDNSGSMAEETEAAEQNINVNLAAVLDAAGVDYRVILITRHREEASSESYPAICVEPPLSGLATCPAPAPGFSERFHHYFIKVESANSFDLLLDTYSPPFDVGNEDRADQAPLGWSAWLRPGAKKTFVEITDDNEDMPASTFIGALTSLAPEHFGTTAEPRFVFHSVVGIQEKSDPTAAYLPSEPIESAVCTGNDAGVESAGETYQELSSLTGGLRFPVCQFTGYDAVFRAIAESVIVTSTACDFAIPDPPAGRVLDLEGVIVTYQPGNSPDPIELVHVATEAGCDDDAFYLANDRVYLCDGACTRVRSDPNPMVDVSFRCE